MSEKVSERNRERMSEPLETEKAVENARQEWESEAYFGPCPQMKSLLSSLADGTLRGLLRRYADAHLARCEHCQSALRGLERLRVRLHLLTVAPPASELLPELTPERRAAVEAAWEQMGE
jgi:anti-sigma factor RsiW